MRVLRLGAGCAMIALVTLGAFGMRDSHQAKLPLVVIAGIIGAAYFSRDTRHA